MHKIGVGTLFRDSIRHKNIEINQVQRFFQQLDNQDFQDFHIVALESNSIDNTLEVLKGYENSRTDFTLIEHEEPNPPPVRSHVNPQRIGNLSKQANIVIDKLKNTCEYTIWIESDLIIPPVLFSTLLEIEKLDNVVMLAPMIYINRMGRRKYFYDTWGFRFLDGRNFGTNIRLDKHSRYEQVSSVGSCAIIKTGLLNSGINFGNNGFVHMCSEAIKVGSILIDKKIEIEHPGNKQVNGRWI